MPVMFYRDRLIALSKHENVIRDICAVILVRIIAPFEEANTAPVAICAAMISILFK